MNNIARRKYIIEACMYRSDYKLNVRNTRIKQSVRTASSRLCHGPKRDRWPVAEKWTGRGRGRGR